MHLLPRFQSLISQLRFCRISFLAFGLLVSAQAEGVPVGASPAIELTPDRTNGVYGKGETACVQIALDPVPPPADGWTGSVKIARSVMGPAEEVAWRDLSKPLRVEVPEKGIGRVVVQAVIRRADNPAKSFSQSGVGLFFRPDEVVLSTPEPRDFHDFWKRQLEAWRKIPREIELNPIASPLAGVECWDLTIRIEGQTPVRGYLTRPIGGADRSLPALLILHGAGFRSAILEGAARASKRGGFLALDINAHGLENGRPKEFYDQAGKELADFRERGVESPETWYFKTMFLRVVSATDYLAKRPEWNGRDLILMGSSQGGGQALAGAALDDRVSAVAASVPAFCDLLGEEAGRRPGWPQAVPPAKEDGARRQRIMKTVGYFDAGNFARLIHARSIISLGLVDVTCPADGIQAMANNLSGETTLLYRPFMGHAYSAEIFEAFDEFRLKCVNKQEGDTK